MANGAGKPRKNRKTRRRRKRKKKMMMTGASLTTTGKKKIAKTKDHPGQLQGELIHPPRKEPQGQERTATDTADERATCCICGASRWHNEYFCAWNYMDGRISVTCREGCGARQHDAASRDALRRFVRVTNLPSSLGQRELERLFHRFGPLRLAVITTRLAPPGRAGFGYVAFKEREHAEEAIDKLNGHPVGDRKLRVDLAYPRA